MIDALTIIIASLLIVFWLFISIERIREMLNSRDRKTTQRLLGDMFRNDDITWEVYKKYKQ